MTVQVSQLSNGMRIVTHRMAGLETATVGVFVGAGARAETDNEHGVAHFLEHMAFKGTPTRTPMQIAEEIEGAGGALNAVTSSEATNYYARVLKDDVELGLNLIGDLLLNPAFNDEEMDREREVILQEIAATQTAPTTSSSILPSPKPIRGKRWAAPFSAPTERSPGTRQPI